MTINFINKPTPKIRYSDKEFNALVVYMCYLWEGIEGFKTTETNKFKMGLWLVAIQKIVQGK
jgi:hypothetical protein